MICPLAYPVVSRRLTGSSCSGAASGRSVPANVLPPLAGGRHGCAVCLLRPGNRAVPQGKASCSSRFTLRPLCGPLASTTTIPDSIPLLVAARAVPAKEKEKRQARGTPFQRGNP